MAARRQGVQANGFIFSSPTCHFWLSSQNLAPDQSLGQRGALVPCLAPSCWNPRWGILCLGAEAASQHSQLSIVLTLLGVGRHFSCISSLPGFTTWVCLPSAKGSWASQQIYWCLVSAPNRADRRGNTGFSLLASNSGHLLRMQKTWIHFCFFVVPHEFVSLGYAWLCGDPLPLKLFHFAWHN